MRLIGFLSCAQMFISYSGEEEIELVQQTLIIHMANKQRIVFSG